MAMRVSLRRMIQMILIALALVAVVFGGWRLLAPVSFYAFNDLDLPRGAGLLSEVRGAGGMMVFAGLIVALGAVARTWTRTSLVVAFALYSALVVGRLLGLVLDGYPGQGVITGLVIESIAAVAGGVGLVRYRQGAS